MVRSERREGQRNSSTPGVSWMAPRGQMYTDVFPDTGKYILIVSLSKVRKYVCLFKGITKRQSWQEELEKEHPAEPRSRRQRFANI